MEETSSARPWDGAKWPDGASHQVGWQDAMDLLRLLQDDYAGARQQLDRVSQTLADRESLLNQRLNLALLKSTGHRTMCLVPYRVGATGSSLGLATLGTTAPMSLPARKPRLEVRSLGRFELKWCGNTITRWQSVKSKAVFEYLMTRAREPVVKDVLMEALWPDSDSRSANNSLKSAVHGLRRTLGAAMGRNDGADLVVFAQGSYMLSPVVDLWVDEEEFNRRWAAGRRLEKDGRTEESIREFELAQALYRGDYLQDEPYEEWTLLRREAIRDTYLSMLSRLAAYALDNGDYDDCITYSQKILTEDHCREDAYRWLMRSYGRLGQRNRAVRWFEMCLRATREGFDTPPDQETQDLYRRLMKNEPV